MILRKIESETTKRILANAYASFLSHSFIRTGGEHIEEVDKSSLGGASFRVSAFPFDVSMGFGTPFFHYFPQVISLQNGFDFDAPKIIIISIKDRSNLTYAV